MPKQRRVRGLRVIEYMAQPTSVKIFGLEGGVLDALETSLSRQRLATYVNAAGGDREQAVRLYTWNTAVSAAFYGPLQGLEVALRNAMHGQLTGVYGPAWFANPACGLDAGALDRIDQAKRTLRKDAVRAEQGEAALTESADIPCGKPPRPASTCSPAPAI
jgi:hypothetical protein